MTSAAANGRRSRASSARAGSRRRGSRSSEWTKLHSLRSTRWSLLVATVLDDRPAAASSPRCTSSHWGSMSPQEQADRQPLDIALAGVNVAQLAIAVLGVLVITGEYSTGMIRASFTAVPKRLPVLWGKIGVFAAVTFALMLPSVLIAFFATQAILSKHCSPSAAVPVDEQVLARRGGSLPSSVAEVDSAGSRRTRVDLRRASPSSSVSSSVFSGPKPGRSAPSSPRPLGLEASTTRSSISRSNASPSSSSTRSRPAPVERARRRPREAAAGTATEPEHLADAAVGRPVGHREPTAGRGHARELARRPPPGRARTSRRTSR